MAYVTEFFLMFFASSNNISENGENKRYCLGYASGVVKFILTLVMSSLIINPAYIPHRFGISDSRIGFEVDSVKDRASRFSEPTF